MKTPIKWISVLALAGAILFVNVPPAGALGFRNPDQGARATAQGEAFVAQADDATAVYYNPAGMAQLEGTHGAGGVYALFPGYKFSGVTGHEEMNSESYSPHFYAVSDFGAFENWRFGVALNVPYGNLVDWGKLGSFRYTVTESRLRVINFAPTVSYKINDQLSIGAGMNLYRADTEIKRMVPFAPIPLPPPFPPLTFPDGRFKFKGDGMGLGATVGVLYKLNEQHAFGFTYRSPFQVDLDGDATLYNGPALFPLNYGPSPTTARLEFPQSVAFGYAFRPIKQLKLEFDIDWTNWDVLNDVRLRSRNPLFSAQAAPAANTLPFHWMDSFFYEFGAQYDLNDHWAVRAGYIFSENTVPERTFSPTIADADRHVFSIGGGFTAPHFSVDIVYQYSMTEDRTVNSSAFTAANGKWESQAHAILLTGTIKF